MTVLQRGTGMNTCKTLLVNYPGVCLHVLKARPRNNASRLPVMEWGMIVDIVSHICIAGAAPEVLRSAPDRYVGDSRSACHRRGLGALDNGDVT